jgi:hypothetical protein
MKTIFVILSLFLSISLFAGSGKMVCDQMTAVKGDATCDALVVFMSDITNGTSLSDGVIWVENLNGKSFMEKEDGFLSYSLEGNTFELSWDAGFWGELTTTDGKIYTGQLYVDDDWDFNVICTLHK